MSRIFIADGEVETAVVAEYERTRQELLRRGIGVGGALVAAGAIPFFLGVRNAFARADGDAAVLEAAVELEQKAVVTYEAAARSGRLDAATAKLAELFRDQEQEHADGLTGALEDLGGEAPPKPSGPEDVEGLVEAAGGEAGDILRFAEELETMALAAYYEAHAKLKDPGLLSAAASIMANEAQHLVVLRQALKKNPSPSALVTGRSQIVE